MPREIRTDFKIIAELIKPNSRLIDIGCGDGELLEYLRDNKNIDARGIEISPAQVAKSLMRGLSVLQGDAEIDLASYPDQSFDYAVLSHTIQNTRSPEKILQEMLRVAKYAIISLPNFAHFRNRFNLLFKGQMPVNRVIPYEWYETPNIRFCTIKDFENLCNKLHFKIEKEIFLSGKFRFNKLFSNIVLANFFAEYGIFVIAKNNFAPTAEAEFSKQKSAIFSSKMTPQFACDRG